MNIEFYKPLGSFAILSAIVTDCVRTLFIGLSFIAVFLLLGVSVASAWSDNSLGPYGVAFYPVSPLKVVEDAREEGKPLPPSSVYGLWPHLARLQEIEASPMFKQAYVRWGAPITVYVPDPETEGLLFGIIAEVDTLIPVKVTVSRIRGNFRLQPFGFRSEIPDNRYCIYRATPGCLHGFMNRGFIPGTSDTSRAPDIRVFFKLGLPFVAETFADHTGHAFSHFLTHSAVFSPRSPHAVAVEGFVLRNDFGEIEYAECNYDAGLAGTLKLRVLRECLIRGLGVVSAPAPCATGVLLIAENLREARQNSTFSRCDKNILSHLYELD